MKTKSEVMSWCEAHGVVLTYEPAGVMSPVHHVHADIDADGMVFRAHQLHNIGLWDECEKPRWSDIGRDLVQADLGVCEDESCSYCGRKP